MCLPCSWCRYVEAKDNVKFLTTLERHFKNISSGNLTAILDTLPSMMNALRMVWVISRHYNTDDQMLPLMRRIASEIADKVCAGCGWPAVEGWAPRGMGGAGAPVRARALCT